MRVHVLPESTNRWPLLWRNGTKKMLSGRFFYKKVLRIFSISRQLKVGMLRPRQRAHLEKLRASLKPLRTKPRSKRSCFPQTISCRTVAIIVATTFAMAFLFPSPLTDYNYSSQTSSKDIENPSQFSTLTVEPTKKQRYVQNTTSPKQIAK